MLNLTKTIALYFVAYGLVIGMLFVGMALDQIPDPKAGGIIPNDDDGLDLEGGRGSTTKRSVSTTR